MERYCFRRIRIRAPLHSDDWIAAATGWLPLVDGIWRVRWLGDRLLVVYDNRKIKAWQILQIADVGLRNLYTLTAQEQHLLRKTKFHYRLPAAMLLCVTAKRLWFGRSQLAGNLAVFELATLVSVFSGYPALRQVANTCARRLHTTDDRLLATAALTVAALRESTTVFFVLMLLNYNAHRKHRQTLVAIAKAGDDIAAYDQENQAPAAVVDYEQAMTKLGFASAVFTALFTRDPQRASAMLLAFSPRLGSLASKYALNQAEIIAHQDCRMLPLRSGEQVYDLAASHSPTEISDPQLLATILLSHRLRAMVAANLTTAKQLHALLALTALQKGTASAVNQLSDAAVIFMLVVLTHSQRLMPPTDAANGLLANHAAPQA